MKTLLLAAVLVAATLLAATDASAEMPSADGLVPNSNIPAAAGYVVQVTSLPGLPKDGVKMPFFSGQLGITVPRISQSAQPDLPAAAIQSMFMHYTIAAPTATPLAEVKDVVLWMSGGPGAPSLWGNFVENGPFSLNEESYTTESYLRDGVPTPIANPYAWSEKAIMVWMDAPPPTGFSFCGCDGAEYNKSDCGVTGGFGSCGTWNDTRAGVAYAESLRVLLGTHFPKLLTGRSFRVVVESYGGVYGAETMRQLWTDAAKYGFITDRLASVSNGDACMGSTRICAGGLEQEPWWHFFFMYGRGQLSALLWTQLMAACGGEAGLKSYYSRGHTPECAAALATAKAAIGSYYTYNILDNCPHNEFDAVPQMLPRDVLLRHQRMGETAAAAAGRPRPRAPRLLRSHPKHLMAHAARDQHRNGAKHGGDDSATFQHAVYRNGYYCSSYVFTDYFSTREAKLAIGVSASSTLNIADNAVGMTYVFNLQDGFSIYNSLLNNATHFHGRPLNKRVRPLTVMAYNADMDPGVNINFVEHVWYEFGNNMTQQQRPFTKAFEWKQYVLPYGNNIGAGYSTRWHHAGTGDAVVFATIRGAGHMAPEFKARGAQAFLEHVLADAL